MTDYAQNPPRAPTQTVTISEEPIKLKRRRKGIPKIRVRMTKP